MDKQQALQRLKAHAEAARASGTPDLEVEKAIGGIGQAQPQQPNVQALISQLIPSRQQNVGTGIGDFLTRLGGGKPDTPSTDDLSKLVAQEAIKKQFDKQDYVVSYDEEGKPVFTQAPGAIKTQPFYATPQGGAYYGARTGQAEAAGKQATVETELMGQALPAIQSAMAGNLGQLPPGASISAGPITFQPNPRLTDTEQAAIAGSTAIEPVVERIMTNVRGGIFGRGNDIERTARQGIVDSGVAMLSSQDPTLQAFQSDINNLKRLIPFTDGGKQLTPFEAKRVFALLNTTGKNDLQIEKDILAAVSIVMAKGGLAIGGRNAALNSQPEGRVGVQMTQEQQAKRERLRQKYGA